MVTGVGRAGQNEAAKGWDCRLARLAVALLALCASLVASLWSPAHAVDAIIVKPGAALANFSAWVIDRKVVDGAVNGIAVAVREGGSQLRRGQTGYVRNYALGVAAGTVALLTWFLVRMS